jgi:hypothetical protein
LRECLEALSQRVSSAENKLPRIAAPEVARDSGAP